MMITRYSALLGCAALCLVLTGCGAGNFTAASAKPVIPTTLVVGSTGLLMGGQQPVAKVDLQLYAAGTSGYGSAPAPMLPAGSTKTDANGHFTLPPWTCPAPEAQMYIIGRGGEPIPGTASSPAVPNTSLALMAALGRCQDLSPSTFININELTTVAAVWALAPFMNGMQIGTSVTNTAGLTAAYQAAAQVVDTVTGETPGVTLPQGAMLPMAELNTLADILEACVNSGGGSGFDTNNGFDNGTPCGKLFFLAPNPGSTTAFPSYPNDTISAAYNIAKHPSRNVAQLYDLVASTPAFQPTLTAAPTDWTVAINYRGGGLASPSAIAIDPAGNVWVANAANSSVTKLTKGGDALSNPQGFTAGSINNPQGIAIDLNGTAWVANFSNNTLTQLDSDGLHGTVHSGAGLHGPRGVAVDGAGIVWVANGGDAANSVSALQSSNGTPLPSSPFTGGGLSSPRAVGVEP